VFGSNDYYSPKLKNPFGYLRKDRGVRVIGERLRTEDLSIALKSRGWEDLNNKKVEFEIEGISIEARGTNDAHLLFDDYSIVAGTRDKKVDLSIGITHAPYGRIIDSMSRDNIDIVFAGHTHGGQVRIPWFGGTRSLTTNCDLPNWRSRGLTKIDGESYLHVSAGMGYNPYTPIRFLCPREVSIIKFLPII
jgi:predicted MPP superfamily phosphohydrolase